MSEGEVSVSIEDEVAAHLGHVQLLGMPDLSAQRETYVAPNRPRWRDGPKPSPAQPKASVALALGIGKPHIGVSQVLGEALEMVRTSKGDDGHLSLRLRDLSVELPQLREMLLAVESTEVAQQNQDGWTAQQSARVKGLAINRQEVEVKMDPHVEGPSRGQP